MDITALFNYFVLNKKRDITRTTYLLIVNSRKKKILSNLSSLQNYQKVRIHARDSVGLMMYLNQSEELEVKILIRNHLTVEKSFDKQIETYKAVIFYISEKIKYDIIEPKQLYVVQ